MEGASFERVLAWVSSYGYAFLFVISVAENLFLLGFVVPGDVAVVIGGALAARAHLDPVLLALAVVAGVVLGANLSFWIGRRGGTPLIERWGQRFSVDERQIRRVEAYFAAHGSKTVFLGSFVSGLKNLVPAVAGASRMGFGRFAIYNAAGSGLRAVALVGVGYVGGANLPRALEIIGSVNAWLVAAALVATAIFVGRRLAKRPKSVDEGGAKPQDGVDGGARS